MRHVIIGAGPAGVIAAETLKKNDPAATVTIIGDEPEPPYSRMAIPYLLQENIPEQGTWLRKNRDHYDALGIRIIRDRVESIDRKAKSVALLEGAAESYDRLLIATGSRPIKPPIEGIDLPQIHPCWTLEDARNIIASAKKDEPVLLMGAGFIGCIILEALARRGVDLSVVEMGDRMVPRMLDEKAGGHIKHWCESKGIAVHTSNRVERIERVKGKWPGIGGDSKLVAHLADGQTIEASLIIRATGVLPNIDFLDGSGIEIGSAKGILVDRHLRSSDENIYAAGDVAEGIDFSTGEHSVQAIQPTAADHGRIAALNMSGRKALHQGCVNMNVLDTVGLVSCSFGQWMGVDGGSSATLDSPEQYRYINLQFEDDILVGASLQFKVKEDDVPSPTGQHGVGILRGLIQSRVRLGRWVEHLREDPSRFAEAYVAQSQAVEANTRAFNPLGH
ncbi:NAD(P)/FAD-dependent oxidoreductase [Thioalkalivibrio sp. HK1]|uniref:NAD(P)/FAD-dependent oxidoreductase n=1 Tax=Thioalkalivibrio sp. HK1 TaxID=1469245 RepID=UPI000471863C|nr:FAD-dependent oxidoreductase [Thioalkalivibrio sp. HK1]